MKASGLPGMMSAALLAGCAGWSAPGNYEQLQVRWTALLKFPPMDPGSAAVVTGSLSARGCERYNEGIEKLRRAYLEDEVAPYLEAMVAAEQCFREAAALFGGAKQAREDSALDLESGRAAAAHLSRECAALRLMYL